MNRKDRRRQASFQRRAAAAVQHFRAGELRQAEALCREMLETQPGNANVMHLLGVVMHQTGEIEAAVEVIARAVAVEPGHAEAHCNLGAMLREVGRLDDAVASCRKAIALKPNYAAAHNNLGVALRARGEFGEAVAALRRAVALAPTSAEAHSTLGVALYDQGKIEEAVASCRKAVALAPDHPGAHNNLGNVLVEQGEYDEAAAAYQRTIALKPDHAEAHACLGNVLIKQGRHEEAVACHQKAVALDPNSAGMRYSLGKALIDRGSLDEGRAAFEGVLAIDPGHADARFGCAVIHLVRGNFAEGWLNYLGRGSTRRAAGRLHDELLGAELSGTRVLVIRDQGLGDEIFFLRFAPGLKARGAWIAYRAHPKIAAMVGRLPFIDRLAGPEEQPEAVDLVLSVGDLPYLLGMTEARDIPPSIELSVLPERSAEMRARLDGLGPPPYIGVTWRAGTEERSRLSKDAPLDRLARVLRQSRGTAVVLQRNPAEGEVDAFAGLLGREAHDLTALNDDLEGMLALVDLLDDYVCVSNTNFHLRTVRGRASRVLVPHPPEFRWMAEGEESPWYPGTRVYRQMADGEWDPAFTALTNDLAAAWPEG